MMQFSQFLIGVAGLLTLAAELACADGGQVRAVERRGNLEIIVFTSPTPMRAGRADISVAVQNTHSGEMRAGAEIVVDMKHRNPAVPAIRATATNEAATNKLLRAALVELPQPGIWDVTVYVCDSGGSQPIQTRFTMEVAAPWPTWMTEWPWFCWPLIPILLFIVHRVLVAAHSSRRPASRAARREVVVIPNASSNLALRIK